MALVTDVYWTCPGCCSRETAQVLGDYVDPEEFPLDAVPTNRGGLRWNPPCRACGKFRLMMPPTIKCEPQQVKLAGDGKPCPNYHDPECCWPNCLCRQREVN